MERERERKMWMERERRKRGDNLKSFKLERNIESIAIHKLCVSFKDLISGELRKVVPLDVTRNYPSSFPLLLLKLTLGWNMIQIVTYFLAPSSSLFSICILPSSLITVIKHSFAMQMQVWSFNHFEPSMIRHQMSLGEWQSSESPAEWSVDFSLSFAFSFSHFLFAAWFLWFKKFFLIQLLLV